MSKEAVVEIETSNEVAPVEVAPQTMTEAEAATSGLSADEIVAGKKHGLIIDEKPAKKTGEAEGVDEEEAEGKEEKPDETVEETVEGKDPKDAADEDLDPEEEQELVSNYNDNEKSLYWKAKKERLKRQNAQSENEHTKIKLAAAQREIDLLKKSVKKTEGEGEEENVEDEGDDDARVMTVGEFKKMLAKQKEGQAAQNAEAQATIVRLEQQEVEFKADHPDFDEVMDLAKEMMDKKPSFRQMLLTAGADPKENAAEIAYSIGQLNPKYKKGGSGPVEKIAPDAKIKVDKAIKNSEKRPSSAAVAGGGTKRMVSEDDLTVEDAANLSQDAYRNLSKKTRDRLLKESCA